MTRAHLNLFLALTALTLSVWLLGACSTVEKPIAPPKQIPVAISRSCVPKEVGPPPQYADPDDVLLGMDDGPDRYVLIAAGRIQRNQRLAVVEPVIAACR